MWYAAYVKCPNSWCLIGFGKTREEAEAKLATRLKIMGKGTKTGIRRYKDKGNAPEYPKKLRG